MVVIFNKVVFIKKIIWYYIVFIKFINVICKFCFSEGRKIKWLVKSGEYFLNKYVNLY